MVVCLHCFTVPAYILIMTDKPQDPPTDKKSSAKDAFAPGKAGEKQALFTAEEMDIYCNKVTKDSFIFHGKDLDYEALDHMVYDPKEHTVDVHFKDGCATLDS